MAKFIKKPVAIEAIEWTGDNLKEVLNFTGVHYSAKLWTDADFEKVVRNEGLKIFTLEGSYMATVGDMIIKGIVGEFYPCKPDVFKKTYFTEAEYADLKEKPCSEAGCLLTPPCPDCGACLVDFPLGG